MTRMRKQVKAEHAYPLTYTKGGQTDVAYFDSFESRLMARNCLVGSEIADASQDEAMDQTNFVSAAVAMVEPVSAFLARVTGITEPLADDTRCDTCGNTTALLIMPLQGYLRVGGHDFLAGSPRIEKGTWVMCPDCGNAGPWSFFKDA